LPPHGGKTTFIVRAQPPRMSSLSHRCHFFWFDSFGSTRRELGPAFTSDSRQFGDMLT
jgi:hypothetical protein